MIDNDALVKFYCSDFVYDFGRFVVITTSQYLKNHKDIIAEVFVLGFDTEGLFKDNQLIYKYSMGAEKIEIFDLAYMESEALNQARILIFKFQIEKYKQTKNIEYQRRDFEIKECKRSIIISLKNAFNYENELKVITKHTINYELREYIELILSIPKLTITSYNS